MKTIIHSIRKHSVVTELLLVGFAVISFVISMMIVLPEGNGVQARAAAQGQVTQATPGGSDSAGS